MARELLDPASMRRVIVYGAVLGAAAVVAVIGIDVLVRTDDERISETVAGLRAAAESGDLTRALPFLDLDGSGFELVIGREREKYGATNLDDLEDRADQGSDWLGNSSVRFDSPTITVEGGRAHAYLRMTLGSGPASGSVVPVDLSLRKADGRWLVTRLTAIPSAARRAARRTAEGIGTL